MMNMLKWILPPVVFRIGGDDGGGDSSGANYEADEARKAQLRRQIDLMYGIGTAPKPTRAKFLKGATSPTTGEVFDPGSPGVVDEAAYNAAVEASKLDPGAAARDAMEAENTKLGDATRSYYTDRLGKDYAKAERETRFKLARQGLMGGSEDIYQQGEVKSDRDLGATRVDDAVRRGVADLKGKREAERLNAVQLVNAGAGDSAVSAAQAGLRNTFDSANSAQRVNLFDDLFSGTADAVVGNNDSNRDSAMANRYRNQLGTFFGNTKTNSGRLTSTGSG